MLDYGSHSLMLTVMWTFGRDEWARGGFALFAEN